MDVLENIVLGLAANSLYDFSKFSASKVLESFSPSVREKANSAALRKDAVALRQIVGDAISLAASSGAIEVNAATLRAIGEIRVDNESGSIILDGVSVSAPTVHVGGLKQGRGITEILGDTVIRGGEAEIELRGGASMSLSGGASFSIGKLGG